MNRAGRSKTSKIHDDKNVVQKVATIEIDPPKSHRCNSRRSRSLLHNHAGIECPICFSTALPGAAIALHGCGHEFCSRCFKSYVQAQIEEGNATNIICPMPADECGKCVQQSELREVLGKDEYKKLNYYALQSVVAADPTLHHCPTPDCSFVFCWLHGDPPLLSCPVCKVSSCIQCKVSPSHDGMTCDQYNEKRQQKNAKRRWLFPRLSLGRKKLSAKQKEEKKTAKYMKKSKVRSCKQCGAQILKEFGCNKMKCRCGYRFCYVCGSENAQCGHTPRSHGYIDNITGAPDFHFLYHSHSPNTQELARGSMAELTLSANTNQP